MYIFQWVLSTLAASTILQPNMDMLVSNQKEERVTPAPTYSVILLSFTIFIVPPFSFLLPHRV